MGIFLRNTYALPAKKIFRLQPCVAYKKNRICTKEQYQHDYYLISQVDAIQDKLFVQEK